MGNASYKLKKLFDGKFMKFSMQFLAEFTRNFTETSNNFREKWRRNSEEIPEVFKVHLKIRPEVLH